jgi:hypothetical protein
LFVFTVKDVPLAYDVPFSVFDRVRSVFRANRMLFYHLSCASQCVVVSSMDEIVQRMYGAQPYQPYVCFVIVPVEFVSYVKTALSQHELKTAFAALNNELSLMVHQRFLDPSLIDAVRYIELLEKYFLMRSDIVRGNSVLMNADAPPAVAFALAGIALNNDPSVSSPCIFYS